MTILNIVINGNSYDCHGTVESTLFAASVTNVVTNGGKLMQTEYTPEPNTLTIENLAPLNGDEAALMLGDLKTVLSGCGAGAGSSPITIDKFDHCGTARNIVTFTRVMSTGGEVKIDEKTGLISDVAFNFEQRIVAKVS